jgi:large subunit ribosomal protein L29
MKAQELREKTQDQLKQEMMGLLEEQFKLRMQRSANQLTKPARMKNVRRDIARIKTVLRENAKGKAV